MNKILICILIAIAIIFTFSPMALANDIKAIHTVGWVSDDKTWEIPASPLTQVPSTELRFTLKNRVSCTYSGMQKSKQDLSGTANLSIMDIPAQARSGSTCA